MKIDQKPYGILPDGREVTLFILENHHGMRAEIINYGGALVRLIAPDREGRFDDVVLGHPSLEGYLNNAVFFGVVVGRNCNRIANAQLTIDGVLYKLEANDDGNNLHSGAGGVSFRLLEGKPLTTSESASVELTGIVEHLGDGFPGNLNLSVIYSLTDSNELQIHYRAASDRDTVINLTNHSYFNLAGHNSGKVYDQTLQMEAPFYTPLDGRLCPTGEIHRVADGPLDFCTAKRIGRDIAQTADGYDNNLICAGSGYRRIATAADPSSGRVMEVMTDLPAVQFFTAGNIDRIAGKDSAVYHKHDGFCLETQFVPNAVHMPWLRSPVFRAGDEMRTTTSFRFTTD